MEPEGQVCKILQLSDCTMMYILSYLDATSLFNLSRTCSYFKNIIEDPQLWRYIEARHEPNSTKKVQYICERVHDKTTHLFLRAESKYNGLVPQNYLLSWGQLEHLTILALENQRLDGRTLKLMDFPKRLEELSLKKTHLKNGKLFFQSSFHTMRNLKVLILDECDWVDSNFFMSIAKYENLEILSIIKCLRLHLNVIPYLSVARHGCKKLKVIDCRFNTVGNEVLRTFDSQKNLLALYFQSMSSYQLDTGTPFLKCPPLTSEYQDLISQSTIKDRSLEQYKWCVGDMIEELPHSVLYKDPYPDCTCGHRDQLNEEPHSLSNEQPTESKSQPVPRTMPVDDFIDFHLSPQRFICKKHVRELNKLPKDFKNFFYQNQKKFYPDSSDHDSDSDDDRDCCMFGEGKSQHMIVLKVREADERGVLPEPEVIDISYPGRNVINIDIDVDDGRAAARRGEFQVTINPVPSTSRHQPGSSSSRPTQSTAKRKAEKDSNENEAKKRKIDEPTSESNEAQPASSSASTSANENMVNAGPSNAAKEPLRAPTVPVARIEAPRRLDLVRVVRVPANDLMQNAENLTKKIKLRRLSLRGYTEVTDAALFNLRNLNLDLLDVTYTGVTKEGVEKFLTINPNCRIIHADYCVCKPVNPCLCF